MAKIDAQPSKHRRFARFGIGSLYWVLSSLRRFLPLATLAVAIAAFYLFKLDGVGVLGPDEPRYAAIGRSMAHTGHWITPRLWGSPWFEKPPLVYWLTALGTTAGWNPDLSARLPIALLSLAFLAACFVLVRREFSNEAAAVSTALLATSAGWITYSQLCLTDLPLAVFFSMAALSALPLLRQQPEQAHLARRFVGIGVYLGLAALAKGLVPIALAVPFLWFLRRYWRRWWLAILAAAAVAGPWYVAVYLKNGYPFIQDFFIRHHFERLYSPSLQHVQPWYYYFPVLLAGLFPWTPLLAWLAVPDRTLPADRQDHRRPFLASVIGFGFLLFSVSLNKLPGYLLPLFPSLFVLIGARFEFRRLVEMSRFWWVPSAILVAAIPLLGSALPQSLSLGRISFASIKPDTRTEWFYIAIPILVVFLARRSWAGLLLVLCVVSGGFYLKEVAYPFLDRQVSARDLWRQIENNSERICDGGTNRDWVFGLSFYQGKSIPVCGSGKFDYALHSRGHGPPVLEPIK